MEEPTLAAYFAGFFDGEGNVRVDSTRGTVNGKSYQRWSLRINIKQVDPRPLNKFAETFGGTVRLVNRHSTNPNWRPIYEWNASSARAYEVLKMIRPYLIVKADHADLAIKFQEMLDARGGSTRPLTPAERADRIGYSQDLATLAHRVLQVPLVVGPGTAIHNARRANPKPVLPRLHRAGRKAAKPRGGFRKGPRPVRPERAALVKDYAELGIMATAAKYRVAVNTVYNWMDSLGIARQGITPTVRARFSQAQRRSFDDERRARGLSPIHEG